MYAISFNASVAARPALSITLRHDPTVERHTRTRTQPGRDGTDIDQLKTNVGTKRSARLDYGLPMVSRKKIGDN